MRLVSKVVVCIVCLVGCFGGSAYPTFDARIFVHTSDFPSTGSCAAVEIDPPWNASTGLQETGPTAIVRHFFGRHFVINHSPSDNIQIIDPETFETILEFSVGEGTNPQDIQVIEENLGMVSCRDVPWLYRVDLFTGEILDSLDLSPLADADGLPEASLMARDGNHLFVQIQRLDRNASNVPVPPSYLAVVDIEAFELMDIDPDTPGLQGIVLTGLVPSFRMHVESDMRRLYVCTPGVHFDDRGGIDEIDLDALASLGYVVSEASVIGNIGGFEMVSPEKGYVVFHTDIVPSTHLVPFSRIDGTVGAQIYQILECEMDNLAFDPATGQLFIPDPTSLSQGLHVFDTVTDEKLNDTPIDVGLAPFDLVVARPDPLSYVDDSGNSNPSEIRGTKILELVHPNPSHGTAFIEYILMAEARVDLQVYDIKGCLVRNLRVGVEESLGFHQIRWTGRDGNGMRVPSGVYVVRLRVGTRTESQKLVLIR
jgi:hypothetical protein